MYLALFYDLVANYMERRAPLRAEHLSLADRYRAEGKLVLAGAFDPPDQAMLVFRVGAPAEVEAFVKADPYVREGLVRKWTIKTWTVVVGGER